jgi:hypothetical protein
LNSDTDGDMARTQQALRKITGSPKEEKPLVSVLDQSSYKSLRRKPGTVEIYLGPALFPQRNATPVAITNILSRKAHVALKKNAKYDAVFHLRPNREKELTIQLKQIRQKMPHLHGKWHIIVDQAPNRNAAKERALKVVSRGKVRSGEINQALTAMAVK